MNTQSMDRVVITDALQQLTPSMQIAGDSTDIKTLLILRAAKCWCALGLKERQWASPEAGRPRRTRRSAQVGRASKRAKSRRQTDLDLS
jgi:hypothetical protein